MPKLPEGVTVTTLKNMRGRVTGYKVKQGQWTWSAETAEEALASREADIAHTFSLLNVAPIILPSPVADEPEAMLVAYFAVEGWNYGFMRPPLIDDPGRVQPRSIGSSGNFRTRRECERRMRCHAAQLAIRLGPAPTFEVIADGLDWLDSDTCETQDVVDQLVRVAMDRAHKAAKDSKLELGFPGATVEVYVADAAARERRRIQAIGHVPSYPYAHTAIRDLRPKK